VGKSSGPGLGVREAKSPGESPRGRSKKFFAATGPRRGPLTVPQMISTAGKIKRRIRARQEIGLRGSGGGENAALLLKKQPGQTGRQ